jgi:putative adhesin
MLRAVLLTTTVAAALGAAAFAQSRDRQYGRSSADWCGDGGDRDRAYHCEVREDTIGGANPVDVDASPNGGIRVHGWDRGDVHFRARVSANADSDAEARRIVSGVRIDTAGGTVRVVGPDTAGDRGSGWSVSFDVDVPRNAMLTLNTKNGGISIEAFSGAAKFHTVNGGISIRDVGGDIRGETTNGGINVDLNGDRWDGQGLDVETRNGAIRMTMPLYYSAALETGTTHGRISTNLPITVQGDLGRQLNTTLGSGGARLRAVTTNGGVSIRAK